MQKNVKLNISAGNRKMGAIPSFSLPSGITCSEEACKTCYLDGCYGAAMECRLPNVRKSYEENLRLIQEDIVGCHEWLNWWFDSPNAPRLFRLHVSGDFFAEYYWLLWKAVARSHPNTKFMAFTKQFEIVKLDVKLGLVPKNLIIIASAWPGVEFPEWVGKHMPIAYMQDGTEARIPENAYHCDGNCAGECHGHCWNMKPGDSVVFDKHGPNIRKEKK